MIDKCLCRALVCVIATTLGLAAERAHADPEWATCDRYRQLLAGDTSAIVPVEDLRVLPYSAGISLNHMAEPVSPTQGETVTPAVTVTVDGTALGVGETDRILAWVSLRSGALVVALVANEMHLEDSEDGAVETLMATGLELRTFQRSDGGFTSAAEASVPLPESMVDDWNEAQGPNRQWQLQHVANQLVLLDYVSHECPGGCLQYCGWTNQTASFAIDDAGTLWGAGNLPVQSTLNGGNVAEGSVFQFETEHLDLDGDGILDQRIRPTLSRSFNDCGDVEEDDEDDSPPVGFDDPAATPPPVIRGDALTSPIRTHRRLVNHEWAWMETDFSDFLLPDHSRAVLRWQHHRLDATLVALGNYVLGLEMVFARPREGRDAYSLLHWLFEHQGWDTPVWPADRARVREMMVGIASILLLVETAEPSAAPTTTDLRQRLGTLGNFGFCEEEDSEDYDEYESRGADVVEVDWH